MAGNFKTDATEAFAAGYFLDVTLVRMLAFFMTLEPFA